MKYNTWKLQPKPCYEPDKYMNYKTGKYYEKNIYCKPLNEDEMIQIWEHKYEDYSEYKCVLKVLSRSGVHYHGLHDCKSMAAAKQYFKNHKFR